MEMSTQLMSSRYQPLQPTPPLTQHTNKLLDKNFLAFSVRKNLLSFQLKKYFLHYNSAGAGWSPCGGLVMTWHLSAQPRPRAGRWMAKCVGGEREVGSMSVSRIQGHGERGEPLLDIHPSNTVKDA